MIGADVVEQIRSDRIERMVFNEVMLRFNVDIGRGRKVDYLWWQGDFDLTGNIRFDIWWVDRWNYVGFDVISI